MVIWLIGLSASGKTTIGRELQAMLDGPAQRWLLVDGDAFREVIGGDTGHDLEERRKNAYRISRLCRFLELQNVNVVACVLSLFPENREFNRGLFTAYREVYVKVPLEKLAKRDNKNLYAGAFSGSIKNVAGVDLAFPEPEHADLVLDNASDTADFKALAGRVAEGLGLRGEKQYPYPRPGQNPEKYQYTAFEGREFLTRYRNSRNTASAAVKQKLLRLDARYPGVKGRHFLADKYALPAQAGFFLEQELHANVPINKPELRTQACLIGYLEKPNAEKAESVTNLGRRFEVTKKLHSHYRVPEWRKTSDAQELILDRILLALALLAGMGSLNSETSIAFNTVLKLNDLLAAQVGDLGTPAELYLASVALEHELEAFARMEREVHA